MPGGVVRTWDQSFPRVESNSGSFVPASFHHRLYKKSDEVDEANPAHATPVGEPEASLVLLGCHSYELSKQCIRLYTKAQVSTE